MKRKILSLLLASILAFSFLPATALADDLPMLTEPLELLGDAIALSDGSFRLTANEQNRRGSVWYPLPLDSTAGFTVSFHYRAWGGTSESGVQGGDGFALNFSPKKELIYTGEGGTLGFVSGASGVELDSWTGNVGDLASQHIAVIRKSTENHLRSWAVPRINDGTWHTLNVAYMSGSVTVIHDNVILGMASGVSLDESVYIGISAATGAATDIHQVANVVVCGEVLDAEECGEDEYCFYVTDQNGSPISGASVVWNTVRQDTDSNGKAKFEDKNHESTPQVTASKDGYSDWSSEEVGWQREENRITTVLLQKKGAYSLSSAMYCSQSSGKTADLLTTSKTLNNQTDVTFSLRCVSAAKEGIVRYELCQKNGVVAESEDGLFSNLTASSFAEGSCFVRVITENGGKEKTPIHLRFVSQRIDKKGMLDLSASTISFTPSMDVQLLGGKEQTWSLPSGVDFTTHVDDEKFLMEIGLSTKDGSIDDIKDMFRSAGNITSALDRLMKEAKTYREKFAFDADVKIAGYVEGYWGSTEVTGKLIVRLSVDSPTLVGQSGPFTANFNLSGEVSAEGIASFNIYTYKPVSGSLELNASLGINVFSGAGFGTKFSTGIYGKATLAARFRVFWPPALQEVTASGELGVKLYVIGRSGEYPLFRGSCQLYPNDRAQLLAAEPHLAADDFSPADLSYLEQRSLWMGENAGIAMLASGEQEEFDGALEVLRAHNYRDAKPVMVSDGESLYAAMIDADAESEDRYVAVTKGNGVSWSEPIRLSESAVLDDSPVLLADDTGRLWLAYTRSANDPGESLLDTAQDRELAVVELDKNDLSPVGAPTVFAPEKENRYTFYPQFTLLDGVPTLSWAYASVFSDDDVVNPTSCSIRYSQYKDGEWTNKKTLVNGASVSSFAMGMLNGSVAVAYVSGGILYGSVDKNSEPVVLADSVDGRVSYGALPGTPEETFFWNTPSGLATLSGDTVPAEGMSSTYDMVGDTIFYSQTGSDGSNLAAVQYDGTWGPSFRYTYDSRYVENLSVARLNGQDYAMGLITTVTFSEDGIDDDKDLFCSPLGVLSNLRLDEVYTDADLTSLAPGDTVPVKLVVTNAGKQTAERIRVKVNDEEGVVFEDCALLPGQTAEFDWELPYPAALTEFRFHVKEKNMTDAYSPDNSCIFRLGFADVATELSYQQIGSACKLIATVVNQGASNTDGVIRFYDADGNEAGAYPFRDLTPGGEAVAPLPIKNDFSGYYGGDVCAIASIEQEEENLENNRAYLRIAQDAPPVAEVYDRDTLFGKYATLQDAFDEVGRETYQNKPLIRLLTDVEERVTADASAVDIDVDLNGHKWKGEKESETSDRIALTVTGGKVRIVDRSNPDDAGWKNGIVRGKVISNGGKITIESGWWSLNNLVTQGEPSTGKPIEVKGGFYKEETLGNVSLADYLANSSYRIVTLTEPIERGGGDDVYTCMVEMIPVFYQTWNGEDYEPAPGMLLGYSRVKTTERNWSKNWYAINEGEHIDINESVTVRGDVNLVLCDGASLTIDGGIVMEDGAHLHIFGQGAGLTVSGGSSAEDLTPLPRIQGDEYDLTGCAYLRIAQDAPPVAASIGAFRVVDYIAEIDLTTPKAAIAVFARYDGEGRFLGAEMKTIDDGDTVKLVFHTTRETREAKLFLTDGYGQPLCSYQSAAQLENGNTP